jgi:hypothetical protein
VLFLFRTRDADEVGCIASRRRVPCGERPHHQQNRLAAYGRSDEFDGLGAHVGKRRLSPIALESMSDSG